MSSRSRGSVRPARWSAGRSPPASTTPHQTRAALPYSYPACTSTSNRWVSDLHWSPCVRQGQDALVIRGQLQSTGCRDADDRAEVRVVGPIIEPARRGHRDDVVARRQRERRRAEICRKVPAATITTAPIATTASIADCSITEYGEAPPRLRFRTSPVSGSQRARGRAGRLPTGSHLRCRMSSPRTSRAPEQAGSGQLIELRNAEPVVRLGSNGARLQRGAHASCSVFFRRCHPRRHPLSVEMRCPGAAEFRCR